jgi:hypothetical protein
MTVDTIVEQVHRLLIDNLPVRNNRTPSGWVTFNCPICTDNRKRAGVITSGPKISFNCFNCGHTTGWSPNPHMGKKYRDLVDKLGATSAEIHTVQMELLKHSEDLQDTESTEYVYSFSKFDTVELPGDVQTIDSLEDGHLLKEYARDRGILGVYPLLHFSDFVNKKRVIVPFTYNGEIIGWTGRHIAPPDKNTPKYLNNVPSGYVFNVDAFAGTEREIVIVTEGIFDAILVDGVAVQGNTVTPEQAHLIDKLGKRVILCPDRDEPGKDLIEQALTLGWEVSFPPWHPDVKDAAEAVNKYGRLLTVASIIKYATSNNVKIQVQSKML